MPCHIIKMVVTLLLGLTAVQSLPNPQGANTSNNIRANYRTSKQPKCTSQNLNPTAPCENDPEYDSHIKARFRNILDKQPISQLLQEVLQAQLSDPSIARVRRSGENREISFPIDGVTHETTEFVEETAACQSVKSTIYPKRGKTKTDDWVFILNQESEQQGVTVETCYKEGSSCNLGGVIPGIETTCRQKYIYKTFLVLSKEENVVPEEILMPSTCVCYVRRN